MLVGKFRHITPRFALCLLSLIGIFPASARAQRTVTPNEHASIFAYPQGSSWSVFGAYVGAEHYNFYTQMAPDALKIRQGRFQHFCPRDQSDYARFPYQELKAYEAQEIAAGRPPIFVTATYQGKKRPVYFNWSLNLVNNRPTSATKEWMQAVNVADQRYINFWTGYARGWQSPLLKNQWQGVDACAFMYSLYGVIDDQGNFVSNVRWDAPFAQNTQEFLTSVRTFMARIQQQAPDINIMCNLGSLEDWNTFPYVYASIPGLMAEDIQPRLYITAAYNRAKIYQVFSAIQWMSLQQRVCLLRASVRKNNADDLRSALICYTLNKGANCFFAPRYDGTVMEVPQSLYAAWKTAIGEPTQNPQSVRETGSLNEGFRLYSRVTSKGILYLNLTGRDKVIPLDPRWRYTDLNGNPITSLLVRDGQGDFARFRP